MPLSPRHQKATSLALKAVAKAANLITTVRKSNQLRASKKGRGKDLVTRADLGAEQAIIATIREQWDEPFDVLSEQGNADTEIGMLAEGSLWIIDSINGTTNYARGDRHCAISIAVAWDQGLQVGVVLAPFLNESFVAVRGHGAFLNKQRIYCAENQKLNKALIGCGFPIEPEVRAAEAAVFRLSTVLPRVHGFRCLGSAALSVCRVAEGKHDGFFDTVNPWEVAAATLIAREAGATVTSYRPPQRTLSALQTELRSDFLLVCCPGLYNELQMLLGSAQLPLRGK